MDMKTFVEFKPSLLRLLVRPLLNALITSFLIVNITTWRQSTLQLQVIAFLFFTFLLFVILLFWVNPHSDLYRIILSNKEVSGPTDKRRRTTIPIEKVDIVKSRRRRWIDIPSNLHRLYSMDDEEIIVYCDAYPKGAFDQMLEIISRLQSDAAVQS